LLRSQLPLIRLQLSLQLRSLLQTSQLPTNTL